MKAAGYQFVNLDDCWQVSRDANGVIVADPTRFPDGIQSLADYVHADGLMLGLYTDHGTATCKSGREVMAMNISMPTPMPPGAWTS